MPAFQRVQTLYWVFIGLLFLLIVGTPYIITSGVSIFAEEFIELLLLVVLTLSGGFVLWSYSRYMTRQTNSYNELVRHVGAINLQVDQIEEIVHSATRVPSSQREIRKMFEVMCGIIMTVVQADWVLIRALDVTHVRTKTEQLLMRDSGDARRPTVANKTLSEQVAPDGCSLFFHNCDTDTRVFVVIPDVTITDTQRTIIQTATTNAGFMYTIFSAAHQRTDR